MDRYLEGGGRENSDPQGVHTLEPVNNLRDKGTLRIC